VLEERELAGVFDFVGCVQEASHGGAVQGSGEADAADSGGGEFGDGKRLVFEADHEVEGLGEHGANGADSGEVGKAGREENIGASLLVGLQTAESFIECGIGIEEIVCAGGESEREGEGARGFGSGGDTFDGEREIVKGMVRIAGRVFDRASGETCGGCETDSLGDGFGRVAKTIFQVRGDRKIGCADDEARVRESLIAGDGTVFTAEGCGGGGAGSGKCPEAEAGEKSSGGNVPGVRNYKCLWTVVKSAEACGFVGLSGGHWSRLEMEMFDVTARGDVIDRRFKKVKGEG
jgi:hypothetical protein